MTPFKPTRRLLLGLFFCSTLAAAEYPDKPVKFVVPFPPGGSFDGPARLLTARLTKLSGQSFVVETRSGAGGAVGAEQIKQAFGINWVHVPYRGTGPAINDLLAGQVTVTVVGLSSAIGHIKAGTLKALAVTSAARMPQLPNVPTVAEIKPNFTIETWIGVAMPPKVPQDAVNRMAALVEQAMKDNELRTQLRELAVEPVFEGPAAATARMAKDVATFAELGKRTGITLD